MIGGGRKFECTIDGPLKTEEVAHEGGFRKPTYFCWVMTESGDAVARVHGPTREAAIANAYELAECWNLVQADRRRPAREGDGS